MPCSHPSASLYPRPLAPQLPGVTRDVECRSCGELVACPHPARARKGRGDDLLGKPATASCGLCGLTLSNSDK